MSADWNAFRRAVPWFPAGRVTVGEAVPAAGFHRPGDTYREAFPVLHRLLAAADVTPARQKVGRAERELHLYGWPRRGGGRFGWLSPAPPPADSVPPVCGEHRLLLAHFGGITERWNEPQDTWLLNLDDALTAAAAAATPDLPTYDWDVAAGAEAFDLSQWYPIAREANGNVTLCRRSEGAVLLYAHDHSFGHVTPAEGYPPYTLYRVRGAATFAQWVECVAGQWLAHVEG